jgi:hypothetical protein
VDQETIHHIAAEVAHRLPYGDRPWLFLLVNAVVMAIVGVLATLGTSYFRTRGQNLATKHDFDELKEQLKANTELVETIKSEVSQRDWAQREWTNIRRIKLEALLAKMHECGTFLDRFRDAAFEGSLLKERDVIDEFVTIADIYFPELWKQTYDFSNVCREEAKTVIKFAQEVLKARDDSAALGRMYADFGAHFDTEKRIRAHGALRDAARSLLTRIMNVDETAAPNDDRHGERRSVSARGKTDT